MTDNFVLFQALSDCGPSRAPSRPTEVRQTDSILCVCRVKVDLSLEELAKVALRAQHDHVYEKSLQALQIELVKLQVCVSSRPPLRQGA